MPWLMGLWAAVVIVLYAAAPGHVTALADLAGYAVPRHGSFAFTTLADVWRSRAAAAGGWVAINLALAGAGSSAARWAGSRVGAVRSWLLGLAPVSLLGLGLGSCGLWSLGPSAAALAGCAGLLIRARPRWTRPAPDAWLAM